MTWIDYKCDDSIQKFSSKSRNKDSLLPRANRLLDERLGLAWTENIMWYKEKTMRTEKQIWSTLVLTSSLFEVNDIIQKWRYIDILFMLLNCLLYFSESKKM